MDTSPELRLPTNHTSSAEATSRNAYLSYIQSSPRWRALRRAVQMRAHGMCEICLRRRGTECAHLTYERLFNERLTDVLWVCVRCHRELDSSQQT